MARGNQRARELGELGFALDRPPFLAEPAPARRAGPRGVYVTSGLDGFYYRGPAPLARGTQPPSNVPVPPAPEPSARATQHLATQAIASARVQHLTDVSQDDFVAALNQWTTRGALQVLAAVAALAALLAAVALELPTPIIAQIAAYGAIAWLLAAVFERRRRRFLLMFDLGDDALARYQRLGAALADLSVSGVLRGVKLVGHHHDSKPNAGATRSLSFEPASLRLVAPPHIVTNLTPWRLATQGLQLYFFPDRILIRSRRRFASLAYDALEVAAHTSNFVWHDALPHDAQVVGQAWRYGRRDTTADRRFGRNHQIPLVRTAYVTIKSATGLEVVVQTTQITAAEQVVAEVRTYGRAAAPQAPIERSSRPELDAALSALGLPTLVMPADLKLVYRELAARNQPDKLDGKTVELRRFTQQRMRDITAAYHVLRRETLPGSAPLDADDATPLARPAHDAPRRFGVEAFAVSSAIVAAAAVYWFTRAEPARHAPVVARAAPVAKAPPPMPTTRAAAQPAVAPPPIVRPPPPVAAPVEQQRLASACTLRLGPSTRARATGELARGRMVSVLDREDGWRLVRDAGGLEGWAGPRCWQPPLAPRRPRPAPPIDAETQNATSPPAPPVEPAPERAPEPLDPTPSTSAIRSLMIPTLSTPPADPAP